MDGSLSSCRVDSDEPGQLTEGTPSPSAEVFRRTIARTPQPVEQHRGYADYSRSPSLGGNRAPERLYDYTTSASGTYGRADTQRQPTAYTQPLPDLRQTITAAVPSQPMSGYYDSATNTLPSLQTRSLWASGYTPYHASISQGTIGEQRPWEQQAGPSSRIEGYPPGLSLTQDRHEGWRVESQAYNHALASAPPAVSPMITRLPAPERREHMRTRSVPSTWSGNYQQPSAAPAVSQHSSIYQEGTARDPNQLASYSRAPSSRDPSAEGRGA
ncbi:hypothetical protein C8Q75DRAFT_779427 [Abortiporus biennis]|nr:hypothetical protein C8Q75DRAFT_779427 [Abortiporus biennis]